jgi:hypothetical protein
MLCIRDLKLCKSVEIIDLQSFFDALRKINAFRNLYIKSDLQWLPIAGLQVE